jgi:lipopolysaccharide biosynthesis protein
VSGFLDALAAHVARRGILSSSSRLFSILRNEGVKGVRARIQFVRRRARNSARQAQSSLKANPLSVVPIYLESLDGKAVSPAALSDLKIAVHLHLYHLEMVPELAGYLSRIPVSFDLFVSVPEGCDREAISRELREQIVRVATITVESVPNRGRDIAPLIVQFGSRLSTYDVVGHFHTKRTPHNQHLANWRRDVFELLIGSDGSGSQVARILGLLQSGAKVVYPEGQNHYIKDQSGWSANRALAGRVLDIHTPLSIADFPEIDFPEGSMFWAQAGCLREFLQLPLRYEDFPEEPIPADGTLAHALERLILVFASLHPGQCVRLHKHDSIRDYRFYEEQDDYSQRLKDANVRVLSYYLPQFHPIPENDRWHGAGFTEWTKVRAANPLFQGHYQQHIPHSDIGYYTLNSAQVLRQQAGMMRKAGIHGQVFYHYWFSGKLILEHPAKMLLENADIDMPFCFCWANENWTRRWDGNEDDILLKQTYSREDARAFIRYLIPFFRDARYITIDGRPLLLVYRPTNIPDIGEYLDAWAAECEAAGLPRPFVAAVLTRGAVNPDDYGMDAGVERVLHDWTDGKVADIADELVAYRPFEGASVLSYAKVAEYYRQSDERKPFTYFRSLVPNWDNSARYGAAGYLLHESTPQPFQEWLEDAIRYTEATLPPDRQFILINAWNEWAEGAHLEPDSRFGYAYLNSVGRALSGIRYSDTLNLSSDFPASERVLVRLTDSMASELRSNESLLNAFRSCLAGTSVSGQLVAEKESARLLGISELDPGAAPAIRFELEFRSAVLFDSRMIQKMAELACATRTSVILANAYGQGEDLIQITDNGSTHCYSAYGAPVVLFPSEVGSDGYRNFRVRTDAHCFVADRQTDGNLPEVTTIVRFHRGGDLDLLQRALFCLAAMKGCKVTPLVAAQDLAPEQAAALDTWVQNVPWVPGIERGIRHFTSGGAGDLRSLMLNKSLQEVKTRYAAFLDFDDLLMPHAYEWLLERLRTTRKAIAIGRVFESLYDPKSEMLLERNRHYQYGYSYDDFLTVNVAPLHSFMLDLSQLNVAGLEFFEDQRFLEDYFLLLQLVTRDNTDWKGLAQDAYIGDYVRFGDNRNTLAIADPRLGEAIRKTPDYLLCERRIRDLKSSLRK